VREERDWDRGFLPQRTQRKQQYVGSTKSQGVREAMWKNSSVRSVGLSCADMRCVKGEQWSGIIWLMHKGQYQSWLCMGDERVAHDIGKLG